jgi:hypothetical protein
MSYANINRECFNLEQVGLFEDADVVGKLHFDQGANAKGCCSAPPNGGASPIRKARLKSGRTSRRA